MALPTTVSTWSGNPGHNPPHKSSGGNYYTLVGTKAFATVTAWFIAVERSSDPATTAFVEQDGANRPTGAQQTTSSTISMSSVSDGTYIHAVSVDSVDLAVEYHRFNMSTNSWDATNIVVADLSGMTAPISSVLWCSIAYRSGAADELVISACGLPDSVMGNTYQRGDLWHADQAVTTAGGWTGPVSIDASVGDYHEVFPSVVTGDGSNVHIQMGLDATSGSAPVTYSAVTARISRSFSTSNTLSTRTQTSDITNLSVNPYSNGIHDMDGSTGYAAWALHRTDFIGTKRYTEDASNNISTASGATVTNTDTDNTSTFVTDGAGNWYSLFSGGGASGVDQDLYIVSSDDYGATWSGETEILAAVTVNYISAAILDTGKIAYLYDDGGTTKYNEYLLATFVAVGGATETGTAQTITPIIVSGILVGAATETDSAQAVADINPRSYPVGDAGPGAYAQLLNNTGFDTDLSGWTIANGDGGVTWESGGVARISVQNISASAFPYLYQQVTLEAGKTYRLNSYVTRFAGGTAYLRLGSTINGAEYGEQTKATLPGPIAELEYTAVSSGTAYVTLTMIPAFESTGEADFDFATLETGGITDVSQPVTTASPTGVVVGVATETDSAQAVADINPRSYPVGNAGAAPSGPDELVTNGEFGTDLSGWTTDAGDGTVLRTNAYGDGELYLEHNSASGSNEPIAGWPISFVSGNTYKANATLAGSDSVGINMRFREGATLRSSTVRSTSTAGPSGVDVSFTELTFVADFTGDGFLAFDIISDGGTDFGYVDAVSVTEESAAATDTAQSVGALNPQSYTVSGTSETDTAQSVGSINPRSYPVGAAAETDSAQTVTVQQVADIVVAVGAAAETNTSDSVADINPRQYAVGGASETDTADAIVADNPRSYTVAGTSGTDSAQGVASINPRSYVAGETTESDTTSGITPWKSDTHPINLSAGGNVTVAVGAAAETDTAQAISAAQDVIAVVGVATEADSAEVVGSVNPRSYAVGDTTETDAAGAIDSVNPRSYTVAAATETDSSDAVGSVNPRSYPVGLAAETSTAQVVTDINARSYQVGTVAEADTAGVVNSVNPRSYAVGDTSETDSAQAVTPQQAVAVAIAAATESDTAQAVTSQQAVAVAIAAATESDTAQPVQDINVRSYAVGEATEGGTAGAVGSINPRSYPVGLATETSNAHIVSAAGDVFAAVGTASEIDTAQPVGSINPRSYVIGGAAETGTSGVVADVNPRSYPVVSAAETDAAEIVTSINPRSYPVVTSVETNAAQPIAAVNPRSYTVVGAVEVATAQPIADVNPRAYQVAGTLEIQTAQGLTVTFPPFNVEDIDGDDTVFNTQVAVISGTNFGVAQGKVLIGGVEQTVNSWSQTEINITVVQGGLSLGAQTLYVRKVAA